MFVYKYISHTCTIDIQSYHEQRKNWKHPLKYMIYMILPKLRLLKKYTYQRQLNLSPAFHTCPRRNNLASVTECIIYQRHRQPHSSRNLGACRSAVHLISSAPALFSSRAARGLEHWPILTHDGIKIAAAPRGK